MLYGIAHLQVIFREFNKAYFGNILPMPYFRIMHGVNLLGLFTYSPGSVPGTTEVIDISDFYDYDGNFVDNYKLGDELQIKDKLYLGDVDISSYKTLSTYELKDLYQQSYWTTPMN